MAKSCILVFMSHWKGIIWAAFVAGLAVTGEAATKTKASLVLGVEQARPGDTIMAGIRLTSEDGWHTYWRNAGESGIPTSIKWELPAGMTVQEILWPVPEKLVWEGLTVFVLHGDSVLLVPLKLASDIKPGSYELRGKVAWLECEKVCVPGDAAVKATLVVGGETRQSGAAALLEQAKKRLPSATPPQGLRAGWEKAPSGDERPAIIEWVSAKPAKSVDFFPYPGDGFEVKPAAESLPGGGIQRLRKIVKKSAAAWPAQLTGVLVEMSEPATAYEVSVPLPDSAGAATGSEAAGKTPSGTAAGAGGEKTATAAPTFLGMMLFGFLGGLILNIMPCVLPVIALKIVGFVNQSQDSPGRVRMLGMVYCAGVLTSFLVLGSLVIAVKKAGGAANWGMQFQSPMFLVAMTTLVTLVALNLFGVFEVMLGGGAMTAASELASKEGPGGAFFNGVLATALATPCTAPFLAPALGFAFAQSAVVILLVFSCIGIGLASPYLVLSCQPGWLRFLPKPGKWMVQFKMAMGFPMLATAVWMMSLSQPHFGRNGILWFGLFLVVLALAAWIWGEFVQRGSKHKGLAMGISLLLVAASYGYALESRLQWRNPPKPSGGTSSGGVVKTDPDGIAWETWSSDAVTRARAAGKLVLVDFTADWCLTCQANKKTSIEVPSVRSRLKELNVVTLLGDYTLKDDAITAELQKFDRAGVPLVLVYPKNSASPPEVLPALLTPGIVLDALNRAAK
jgi:thiol:disulfide interchange protein/DsbC/DsbD-like thiol-disulfide interchange protein